MKNKNRTFEIKTLIDKYYSGISSLEEDQELTAYFLGVEIDKSLQSYTQEFIHFDQSKNMPLSSDNVIDRVLKQHDQEQGNSMKNPSWLRSGYLKIAASVVLALVSFGFGYYSRGNGTPNLASGNTEIHGLKSEIAEMKQLMISSFLDQKQNHQKLYALTMTSQLESIDGEILNKVLFAVKNDDNVNIRLAATDILFQFANNSSVQDGIVDVFPNQNSPLVILELVRIIKSLDEESSVELLERILNNESLEDSVKTEIINTYKSI